MPDPGRGRDGPGGDPVHREPRRRRTWSACRARSRTRRVTPPSAHPVTIDRSRWPLAQPTSRKLPSRLIAWQRCPLVPPGGGRAAAPGPSRCSRAGFVEHGEEGQLEPVRGPQPRVAVVPGGDDRVGEGLGPALDELAGRGGRVGHLERDPDRPGDPLADLDLVDQLGLSRGQELQGGPAGVQDDPTAAGPSKASTTGRPRTSR